MMTDSLHIKGTYFLFSLAAFFLAFLLRFSSSPNSVRVLFAGLASAPWFLFLLAIIKSPYPFTYQHFYYSLEREKLLMQSLTIFLIGTKSEVLHVKTLPHSK